MSSPPLPESPSLTPLFTYQPFDHSSRIFKRSGEFPSPTGSERKAEAERLEREAEIFGSPTLRPRVQRNKWNLPPNSKASGISAADADGPADAGADDPMGTRADVCMDAEPEGQHRPGPPTPAKILAYSHGRISCTLCRLSPIETETTKETDYTREELTRHENQHHTDEAEFTTWLANMHRKIGCLNCPACRQVYNSVLPLQKHLLGNHRLDGHVPARIFRIAYEACAGSSDESDREQAARALHIVKDSAAYLKLRYESQFHGKRYTAEARQVFAFEKQQIGFSTMDELLQMLDSGASIFSRHVDLQAFADTHDGLNFRQLLLKE